MTGAAAGWSGFTQMAFGSVASQLVGSLQTGWPLAVFWFMAAASMLALLTHWLRHAAQLRKRMTWTATNSNHSRPRSRRVTGKRRRMR